jgi:hypothetical protein
MERVIRYVELGRRLDRMAAVYGALGLAVGERVALLVGNRFEFVEAAYRNAGRPRKSNRMQTIMAQVLGIKSQPAGFA